MKKREKKGSALVISLIMMGVILVIALSITLRSLQERKAAIGGSKSDEAYQNAETGIEAVMNVFAGGGISTANDIQTKLGSSVICSNSDGRLYGTNYILELKKNDETKVACNDASTSAALIQKIKSVGISNQSQRIIEAGVACKSPLKADANTVGLWHFEDNNITTTIADSSSHGNNGTAVGTNPANGICNARAFDGSTSYIKINDSSDFNFAGNDFTIEAWVYFTSLDAGTNPVIISHWNGGSVGIQRQFEFYYSVPTSKLTFDYSITGKSPYPILSVPWNALKNQWYHVAAVRRGSTIYFYVNGAQIGSGNVGSDILWNSSYNVNIGATMNDNGSGPQPVSVFNGDIDEVWISKVGKAASDIKNDYNSTCAKLTPMPSPCPVS